MGTFLLWAPRNLRADHTNHSSGPSRLFLLYERELPASGSTLRYHCHRATIYAPSCASASAIIVSNHLSLARSLTASISGASKRPQRHAFGAHEGIGPPCLCFAARYCQLSSRWSYLTSSNEPLCSDLSAKCFPRFQRLRFQRPNV